MREAIDLTLRMTFDTDAALPLERQVEGCLADIERLRDADRTTGVALTGVQILDQVSEHDTTRYAPTSIVVPVPKPEPTRLFADDVRDSDGQFCSYFNRYHCSDCEEQWTMQWSCACNDRCPGCNRETEPHRSDHLVHSDQCKGLTFELRILGALISACELLGNKMLQDAYQEEIAETGLDAVLSVRGAVDPLEPSDLFAIIGALSRQLSLKRSMWALDQGEDGLDADQAKPLIPTPETSPSLAAKGV